MTHRDLAWRGAGLALITASAVIGSASSNPTRLLAFALAVCGLVLLVQGRRVPAALRVERSRHRGLPQAIRERRRKRWGSESIDR